MNNEQKNPDIKEVFLSNIGTYPKMLAIAAPSGTGKTSIVKNILRCFPDDTVLSVSATTRKKRDCETDGVDYFFLSEDDFKIKLSENDFIEWENIYGDYYGSLKSEVEKLFLKKKLILFELDVKGCLSLKNVYTDAKLVFIQPPGLEELEYRLRNRKTEDEATIQRRMSRAKMEIEQSRYFDFQVVNDDLGIACNKINEIVKKIITNKIKEI